MFGIEDIWPVPLQDIIGFIAHMFKKGFSYSTVNCYISGLSFYNQINNYEDHTQMFIVRKMIDGIKRTTFKKDARLPITWNLFCRILGVLESVCSNIYESNLFKAAFCLAFFGLFSVGRLTETKGCESKHAIKVDKVKLTPDHIEIFLMSSKTDQFGKGTTIYISEQKVKAYCPVYNLGVFLESRPSCGGPLLCHFNTEPLSRYQFSTILKRSLSLLGVQNTNFTSHSFWIGMATTCAMEGLSNDEIMTLGRWTSGAFRRYIRIPC